MSTAIYTPGIKTGLWRNYDHGQVHGATLTLSARNGGYLIAFLALYVSVTGTQLWVIVRFVLHQFNTRRRSQTVFYAQQQLVLRNSEGTLNTAWRLLQVGWAWRRLESHSVMRSLHFILPAVLVFGAFFAGGIFSSEVSKAAGSGVLIKSSQCGTLDLEGGILPDPEDATSAIAYGYNIISQILSAKNYAQSCYARSTNRNQCLLYVKQQLTWTTTTNATCPFEETLCILNGTRSLQLDTGLIDSHSDLGMNASPENRVQYRKVTTCAPIHTEPFSSYRNSSFIGEVWQAHNFLVPTINDTNWGVTGPFLDLKYGTDENSTYSYNLQDSYNDIGLYEIAVRGQFENAYWTPISELNRADADIVLLFLGAGRMYYISPVDDPWFAAHRKFPAGNPDHMEGTWMPDALV